MDGNTMTLAMQMAVRFVKEQIHAKGCGIRWIADRIPTQAGQQSDDCGQPMKAA